MSIALATKFTLAAAALSAAAMASVFDIPATAVDAVVVPVSASHRLAVARDEVSWSDWRQCYEDGACDFLPKPGRKDREEAFPVVDFSWQDAGQYIAWLNARTGQKWRMPTLAEWNAIAAALPRQQRKKLFADPRLAWAADYAAVKPQSRQILVSGSFTTLANGVRDLDGNVWEWTATCAVTGVDIALCPAFVAAGEHEAELPYLIRDPVTGGCATGTPPAHVGLRVVRDL